MKAIIYYSLSSQTKKACEERFEGDFYLLKGKSKIPKSYAMQLIYLGMFATLNSKLSYQPIDIDFDKYDEIVLASPVWAWTIVPFIKKFLKDHPFKDKKVTLLITHMGGPGKTLKKFQKRLHPSNVIIQTYSIQTGRDYENANIIKKS
jgi:cobalamin biosynthesis Co2+ chelatase CbiK